MWGDGEVGLQKFPPNLRVAVRFPPPPLPIQVERRRGDFQEHHLLAQAWLVLTGTTCKKN